MIAIAARWGVWVGVGVWGLGGEVVHAQGEPAVLSMVQTAVAELGDAHGPIVQLESRFRCHAAGQEEQEERGNCPVTAVEALLTGYAAERGALLVDPSTSSPHCMGTRAGTHQDRGFRMTLAMEREANGVVWARIILTCELDPNPMGTGFLLAYGYPFRLMGGAWKRSGEVESVRITP